MKLLILDYLRRKGWIVGLAAILELVLGGVSAITAGRNNPGFSGLQLQLGIFTGAILLQFDLQRGLARTAASLPLTARQIGRAWWLCTVALPTAGLSVCLFLGAGAVCLFNPQAHLALGSLATSSIFLLAIMGTTFPIIMAMNPSLYGSGWQRGMRGVLGGLWGAMIGGGFWFLQNLSTQPVKMVCFLSVAAILTVFGWWRAEQLAAGRASFRLGTETGGQKRGQSRMPLGYGGISYFITTGFVRAFSMGVAMIAMMVVIFYFQNRDWKRTLEAFEGMGGFPFWFVIFFSLIPAVLQMRFLRSLPISSITLAVALMATIILPLLALGALTAGIIGLASGPAAALNIVNSYLLTLPAATLSVVFFAWRGNGTLAYGLMILAMLAAQTVPLLMQTCFHVQSRTLGQAVFIAVACVLFSFSLTHLALVRTAHAYRVQPNPFGQAGWGWGR